MKYEKITAEDQRQMLEARKAQLEQTHFHHQLNIEDLEASGDKSEGTQAAIQANKDAQAILDIAWVSVVEKLEEAK